MIKKLIFLLLISITFIACKEDTKSNGKAVPDNNANKRICYIQSISEENGKFYLKADFFDWFSDEEAGKAMKEDDPKINLDDMDGIPPDGYYIRNEKIDFTKVPIDANVKIIIENSTNPTEDNLTKNIGIKEFKTLFSGENKKNYTKSPFWVELKNNTINSITEQFIP